MPYADPNKLRRKFNTQAGREAFERLQRLGNPRWVYQVDKDKIYLSPTLEIKKGGMLTSTGAGWGQNVDDIVIAEEKAIIKMASEPGALVVANACQPTRREYAYDKATNTFTRHMPGQKDQRSLF